MMSFLERAVNHRVNDGSSIEEQLSPEGLDLRTLEDETRQSPIREAD
jgi:hypothetical protein